MKWWYDPEPPVEPREVERPERDAWEEALRKEKERSEEEIEDVDL